METAKAITQVVESPQWTERGLQDAVYIHCSIKGHEVVVPNSCVFAWESDVISITRTDFVHEFEIKISRADFKADAKKDRARWLVDPVIRRDWLDGVHERPVKRPNYFHYVVPKGLIEPGEVPEYAGLIYVNKLPQRFALSWLINTVVKEPKRLHSEKIDGRQLAQLARAVNIRYWRQRLNK
jgi:hypothetical protein